MGMFAAESCCCASPDSRLQRTHRCGVNCLFVAVLSQDPSSEVKLDELRKMLRPGPDGNSLKELEVAAGAAGMNTQPVRTTLDSLVERKPPFAAFIAHLKQGHFVLFTDVTETTVSIADPQS
ncbi:MAG: cysteine peptidase family C39 domain-containing protein [Planctomycetaceae bacterium]